MAKLLNPSVNPEVEFKTVSKGWKPGAVKKVFLRPFKTGKNKGGPRLSVQYTVTGGKFEGENLFGSGGLVGDGAKYTRRDLVAIAPDIDWGDYELPDTKEMADAALVRQYEAQLNEDLVGRECFILVGHGDGQDGEVQAEVKRVAPESADIEIPDDEDE